MLIPLKDLQLVLDDIGVKRTKVLMQIGVHKAEEHELWINLGFEKFIYVEPIPQVVEFLNERFKNDKNVQILKLAVSDSRSDVEFNVWDPTYISSSKDLTNNSLELDREFRFVEKLWVQAKTLDDLLSNCFTLPEMLVIDVQGSEFEILEQSKLLERVPIVLIELLYDHLYFEQTDASEIKALMTRKGFVLVKESFDQSGKWSDAAFSNEKFVCQVPNRFGNLFYFLRRLRRRLKWD